MASIVKERMNFRKPDYVSGEFCDQPMAQVDPLPALTSGRYGAPKLKASERAE